MTVSIRARQASPLLALLLVVGCAEPPRADVEPGLLRAPVPAAVTNPDIPEAVRGTFALKCLGCHGSDGKGGPVAPNLFALESRRSATEWTDYIKNPAKYGKRMPPVPTSDAELRPLGEWLERIAGPSVGKPSAAR
jgi:mono/diheme cytochrome c family protein